MILVTAASGTTGRAVVSALTRCGLEVRAFVNRQASAGIVQAAGTSEVFVGDLANPSDVRSAMNGVRSVYHICPSFSEELRIGKNVIEAATAEKLEHFVFHSVFHPFLERLPHHVAKLRVCELLVESQLPYTILEPAQYMQNVLRDWESIKKGIYALPYSPDVRMRVVDIEDVAEAAARVLTETGFRGGIYELCGPVELTRHEMAAIIGEVLGRPVRAELADRESYSERMSKIRSPEGLRRQMAMVDFYEEMGLRGGNPAVLEMLIRRPATTFRQVIERIVLNNH